MASSNDTQKTLTIKRFDGGMSDDIREPAANKFSITKHFDIFSSPYRLTPYRDLVADTTGQLGVGALIYTSTSYLLGLGTVSGHSWPQIYYKTGASLITDTWGNKANWVGTGSQVFYELFVEFNAALYFWSSTALVKGLVNFGSSLNESFEVITTTFRCQGIVHSASNILYIPYSTASGTFIATIDSSGTFTAAAFTIPSNFRITSICEQGVYLAVGCLDANGGNSKIMLWDLASAKATQIIDMGPEALYIVNNLEGALIGISTTRTDAFSVATSRITIRRWAGGFPTVVNDLTVNASNAVSLFQNVNFVKNNRLYFSAVFGTNIGLFAYGRKSASYNYAVTLDRFATNDNSETGILAALILGDICWTVHTAVGTITRTNDQASYTATSIYESQKFRDYPVAHVDSVTVQYPPLPSAGQVVAKLRKDSETDWTAVFRDTTDNATRHDAVNIESNSDAVTISIANPAVATLSGHNLIAGQAIRFYTTGALPTGITAGLTYYVLTTSLTSSTFKFSTSAGGSAVVTTGTQSGTHTIERTAKLPLYRETEFRLESTGGAEILSHSFDYSQRKTLYG